MGRIAGLARRGLVLGRRWCVEGGGGTEDVVFWLCGSGCVGSCIPVDLMCECVSFTDRDLTSIILINSLQLPGSLCFTTTIQTSNYHIPNQNSLSTHTPFTALTLSRHAPPSENTFLSPHTHVSRPCYPP